MQIADRGNVVIRAGPIKSEFSGTIRLTEAVPPHRIAGSLEGNERKAVSPDEAQIREYLAGNLCRCRSYQKILEAVKAASEAGMEGG